MKQFITKITKADDLKSKTFRGSVWTIFGYVSAQVLRLAANLILTRLLFPEAFGLMAIVNVVILGITLFSDIGIGPSIIQNKRGTDPDFYNTAWTIQILRGIALCLITIMLAWPLAIFYNEPQLRELLFVASLTALISGFFPTKIFTANRNLTLGRLTTAELLSQALSLVVMVIAAWAFQSVWALVSGAIVGALFKLTFTHILIPGERNHCKWDTQSAKELFNFGRWIFISTAATFISGQGLRLLQTSLVTINTLAMISIAVMLAGVTSQLINMLSSRVFFSSLSTIFRTSPATFKQHFIRTKNHLLLFTQPIFLCLIYFGESIVELLYDERYLIAGEYLVMLAWVGACSSIRLCNGAALLAQGKSQIHMLIRIINAIARPAAMFYGFHLGDCIGMFIALGVIECILYPLDTLLTQQFTLKSIAVDITALTCSTLVLFNHSTFS